MQSRRRLASLTAMESIDFLGQLERAD